MAELPLDVEMPVAVTLRPTTVAAMDKVKLHRCSWTFLHTDRDACWKVQRHLDEAGIPYEIVKHGFGKGARPDVEKLSGQSKLPVLEFDNGSAYRAESDEMVARVKAGNLFGGSA